MLRQVLFVCTGNTCRSPMAEGLLRVALPATTNWRVVSAGIAANGGSCASAEAVAAMAEERIDISAHRSQAVTRELVSQSAVIIAMTRQHADVLGAYFPDCTDRTYLMTSFDPDPPKRIDVTDPFGGTLADYRDCLHILQYSIRSIVHFLTDYSKPFSM